MSIVVEDLGEIAYGGLVQAAGWWDEKRIADGALTSRDILKKFETWAYLLPGGGATIMSAFGVWQRQETWLEHISHGFMYDFPRFLRTVVTSMQGGGGTASKAVAEAQRLVRQGATAKHLSAAGRATQRSYEPEFNTVGVI
ncbi:MAG: hypothetical protein KAR06_02650 [Deltaproteobacteria bacterium]|nr:hypothetical protein [Deltaproteobacteria bacterium]